MIRKTIVAILIVLAVVAYAPSLNNKGLPLKIVIGHWDVDSHPDHVWANKNFLVFGFQSFAPPIMGKSLTRWIWINNWFLVALFSAYPVILCLQDLQHLKLSRRLRYRRELGLCLNCGYDLRGNRSGTCSECGESCPRPKELERF